MDRWEPDIPSETISWFLNMTALNKTYPGVVRPAVIWHVTPIVEQKEGKVHKDWKAARRTSWGGSPSPITRSIATR